MPSDVPDRKRDRLPLPEQEQKKQAGERHIGAALARDGNDFGPPLLEGGARHDAVLDRKCAEQQQVDDDGLARTSRVSGIDRPWHPIITDETDQVEARNKEGAIADDGVEQDQNACGHECFPLICRRLRCRMQAPGPLVAGGLDRTPLLSRIVPCASPGLR